MNRHLQSTRRRRKSTGIAARLLAVLAASACVAVPTASSRLAAGGCDDPHETMCGDGGAATGARLLRPLAVSVRADGGFLVADAGNDAVRSVSRSGVITTVAGLGSPGYSGDKGPAIAAQLDTPSDVAVAPDGSLLIADTGNDVIRRVAHGTIRTVAGTRRGGGTQPATTPASATTVQLAAPRGVGVLPDGGYLIADTGANLILRVSSSGQLQIVAGTGEPGYSGDRGQAQQARLNGPTRVLPTKDRGFLILDTGNSVVRRVNSNGLITTIRGGSTSLDHDLFGQLTVNPGGLALDPTGNLFLFQNRQVVKITPTGTRTVIAGTGDCGSTGDRGPALAATFATPTGLAYTNAGLLITDYNNQGDAEGNVRLIHPDGTISTVAGRPGSPGCVGAGGSPSGALWPVFYITAPRQARAYRPIVITFASTRASTVRTSLVQRGRRIRTINRPGTLGLNTVTLSPGVPRGTYTMQITATATVENNNPDQGGTLKLDKQFAAPLVVAR